MGILVAKKYVKGLIKDTTVDQLLVLSSNLQSISSAYTNKKFINIIESIEVHNDKKKDLILSFIDDINIKVKNLIELLSINNRLNIIPDISIELQKELSIMTNEFNGVVYSNYSLDKGYINNLEEKLSKRLNIAKLSLINKVCDYDGIKVDIENLGISISFDNDRFKSDMINHILKVF